MRRKVALISNVRIIKTIEIQQRNGVNEMNKQKIINAIADYDELIAKCQKVIDSDPAAVAAKVPAFMERVEIRDATIINKARLEKMF